MVRAGAAWHHHAHSKRKNLAGAEWVAREAGRSLFPLPAFVFPCSCGISSGYLRSPAGSFSTAARAAAESLAAQPRRVDIGIS